MEDESPVSKYTAQLYFHSYKDATTNLVNPVSPIPITSGIFIKASTKYFLITCKHVFENILPIDVIILASAGFSVRLPKEIKFINNETNSIVIALVEFCNERLGLLKTRYSFLSYRNIEFGHVFDEDLFYMLFGFINRRTILKNYAFDAEAFGFLTNTRNFKNFSELGFNYEENVTLEYNRRKQSDMDNEIKKMGPRDIKGLSGGGIWLSKAGKKANTYRYVLVGIMIEERLDRGFIIGTKICIIQNELN